MPVSQRRFASTILLVLVLLINLLQVNTVLADDSTPTPAPSEETTPPPVEPSSTETPTSEVSAAPAEDQPVAEQEAPVSELMSGLPENTEVIVVDDTGTIVPLGSQDAAAIMVEADPMWCPEGVLPNGLGCTTNLTVSQLLDLMELNTGGQFSMNGVIYFENSGLSTYNTSFVLNDSTDSLGASYSTLSNFNITLQGGWNGGVTNTFDPSQPSLFDNNNNAVVQVGSSGNPWLGNVTINDFFVQDNTTSSTPSVAVYTTNGSVTLTDITADDIDNATAVSVTVTGSGSVSLTNVAVTDGTDGSGITVTTNSGNITFNNVDVLNQEQGNTANLFSQTGNISISNGSDFDGANFGDLSQGFVATTVSGSITINGSDFTDAAGSGTGTNYNGATLSAPVVSLTNVTSTGNDLNGIAISNVNQVTLNNVTASKNGTEIAGGSGGGTFSNDLGSGILVNGNAGSWVSVLDGNFLQNQRFGIEVFNATIYIGSAIDSCQTTSSSGGCTNVTPITDTTGPVTTFVSRLPAANANGWNNTNVTVTWSCVDKESGVVSSTITQTLTTDGSNQSASGTCTNKAGLKTTNTQTGINIDKTAPAILFTGRSPAANGNGWNNTSVTLNWSCTDALSGIASSTTSQTVSTEGTNQSATGTCTDRAGNTSTNTQTGINIDWSPPSASATALPAANGNGWNNSAVTVSFSGTDAISGIDSCSANVVLSSEGTGQSASGTCTDLAGNTSAVATAGGINIDLTAPALSLPANITVPATSAAGAVVNYSASASDNFDPSPSFSCSPVSGNTFPIGTTTVNCSSTDQAGNTETGTFSVTVQDTTAPTLTLPANIITEATSASGAAVTFSASAIDLIDGPVSTTCIPASGTTFPLGTTTVNCSAADSQPNTSNGSFTVTVEDTTPPVISPIANITTTGTGSGKVVTFAAPASNDLVDGAGVAACSPPSGTVFPVGTTTVTCSATDTAGNTSSITFSVLVTFSSTPSTPSGNSFGGNIIVVTGGNQINLGCFTEVFAFGVKLTFLNLCGHQTIVNALSTTNLPAPLPAGYNFVKGLDVRVLKNGIALAGLPDNTGIELDFTSPGASEYALLYWDGTEWIEITESIEAGEVNDLLADAAGDELFMINTAGTGHSRALTTEPTGIFVLVKK